MGQNSMLTSPKMEEQLVPDSIVAEFFETNGGNTYITDEFEGILGIKDEELAEGTYNVHEDELNWDFMEWEEFSFNEEEETEGDFHKVENSSLHFSMVKSENCGFLDDDDDAKKMCLNLSLNYQDVMDAWSDHGPLWAEDFSLSPDENNRFKGEVPVMEEDRTRREASVLRYKEKRQNRLFSKKIRYQVRKLNADKRPRLKGRFVKRDS